MATLSMDDVVKLAARAGFPKDEVAVAGAVAKAESSLRTDAINRNTNGTKDVGLWQINSVHGYPETSLKNPAYNASAAYQVWKKQGWSAWVAHKSGAYQAHIEEAFVAGVRTGASTSKIGLGDLDDIVGGVVNDPQGALDAVGTITGLNDLFSLDGLFRQVLSVGLSIVFSTAALALIALGLFRLTGTDAGTIFKAGSTAAGGVGALKAVT